MSFRHTVDHEIEVKISMVVIFGWDSSWMILQHQTVTEAFVTAKAGGINAALLISMCSSF